MGTPAMVLPELGKDYAFKHARCSFRRFFGQEACGFSDQHHAIALSDRPSHPPKFYDKPPGGCLFIRYPIA
ncbi:hypothetical protein FOH24_01485 [Acetobacter tropicalis]|nr:hypothetical protein [Acetobacter tropicalis]KAA8389895.1 hypothetical protein FOH22_03155 [Acetobacter tropicalis]KAA8392948.1 hypothetical protein FOH24_01485 [Acetobacter tropicalis]MBC9007983.1 hypothetical protein [Acetobacter tropicalis]MDO8172597.1 hypothetical protein [Acetobacter tropicalis]